MRVLAFRKRLKSSYRKGVGKSLITAENQQKGAIFYEISV